MTTLARSPGAAALVARGEAMASLGDAIANFTTAKTLYEKAAQQELDPRHAAAHIAQARVFQSLAAALDEHRRRAQGGPMVAVRRVS